jgi:hypothetical protein
MNKKPKKHKRVRIEYGNNLMLPNLTKGEAVKIAHELLEEYNTLKITIEENEKPN